MKRIEPEAVSQCRILTENKLLNNCLISSLIQNISIMEEIDNIDVKNNWNELYFQQYYIYTQKQRKKNQITEHHNLTQIQRIQTPQEWEIVQPNVNDDSYYGGKLFQDQNFKLNKQRREGEKVIKNIGEVSEGQPTDTDRMCPIENETSLSYLISEQINSKIKKETNVVRVRQAKRGQWGTYEQQTHRDEVRHSARSDEVNIEIRTKLQVPPPEVILQSLKEYILKLFKSLRDQDMDSVRIMTQLILGDVNQKSQLAEENIFIFLGLGVLFGSQELYIYIQQYISKLEFDESAYIFSGIATTKEINDLDVDIRSKLQGYLLYYSIRLQLPEIYSYLVNNNIVIRISYNNILGIVKNGELELCQELVKGSLVTIKKGNLWAKFSTQLTKKYTLHILDQNMILELMIQADNVIIDSVIKEYIEEHKIKINEDIVCELIKGKRLELIEILEEEIKLIRYYYKERSLGIAIEQEQWRFVLRNIHILEDRDLDQATEKDQKRRSIKSKGK